MTDMVKQIIPRAIQLADQITKAADNVSIFKVECANLKSKSEKLAALLLQAARATRARFDHYERPTSQIIHDAQQGLEKAFDIVTKCGSKGLISRLFPRVPVKFFRRISSQLENSIGDVSWLLRISAARVGNDEFHGMPPIATSAPTLYYIWENIATLYKGSLDARSDAAVALMSLAQNNVRDGKLVIEEGGVVPLLKLAKDGGLEGKENAAWAIAQLGRDPESVEHMIHAGICPVFAEILKEGAMKVQIAVAWAVSEFASNHPECQAPFAENNIIGLLVGHLAFKTVQENSKYAVAGNKNMTSRSAVMASNPQQENPVANTSSRPGEEGNNSEDPATKAMMKVMCSRALWHLASGNPQICKSITESRALLAFAALLEKGNGEVQQNSAMTLMKITAVAEQDVDLRRRAFKPSSHACKAVVDQLLKIMEKGDSDLLIPCIKSVGHLARTFKASESRIICSLVKLLDNWAIGTSKAREESREAVIALTKFASPENYLQRDHSKAIINAGGAKHLINLIDSGNKMVTVPALVLLSYVAINVPDHQVLAREEVLELLEWCSREDFMEEFKVQDTSLETLLPKAITKLRSIDRPL